MQGQNIAGIFLSVKLKWNMGLNDPLNQSIFEELTGKVKLVLLFLKWYFAQDRNIWCIAIRETRHKIW